MLYSSSTQRVKMGSASASFVGHASIRTCGFYMKTVARYSHMEMDFAADLSAGAWYYSTLRGVSLM